MIGRRVGTSGGAIDGGGAGRATIAASTRVAGTVVAGIGVGAGTGVTIGSFRTEDGTSGRGANSATRASIWRRLRPQALARTASRFSGVRCRHHGKTPTGSSRLDTVAGGVLGETEHLRAVIEERTVASGGVERRSVVERGQVGHELGRCPPLLARERTDTREEILIRQARGENEHVRVHAPVYHGEFRGSDVVLACVRSIASDTVPRA